jgi:hypothetical protein
MSLMIGPKFTPKGIKLANRKRCNQTKKARPGYTVDRYAEKRGYCSFLNRELRMPLHDGRGRISQLQAQPCLNTLKAQAKQMMIGDTDWINSLAYQGNH